MRIKDCKGRRGLKGWMERGGELMMGRRGGGGGRTFDFNVMRPTYLIAFFSQSKKQTKMEWIRLHIRFRLYLWSSYRLSLGLFMIYFIIFSFIYIICGFDMICDKDYWNKKGHLKTMAHVVLPFF